MSKFDLGTNVVYTLPYQLILPELEMLAFIGLDSQNEVNIEYQNNQFRPLASVRIYDNNANLPNYSMEGGLMYHVIEGSETYDGTQYAQIPPGTTRMVVRVRVGTVAFNFSGRTRLVNQTLYANDWGFQNAYDSQYAAPTLYSPYTINASQNYILEIGSGSL